MHFKQSTIILKNSIFLVLARMMKIQKSHHRFKDSVFSIQLIIFQINFLPLATYSTKLKYKIWKLFYANTEQFHARNVLLILDDEIDEYWQNHLTIIIHHGPNRSPSIRTSIPTVNFQLFSALYEYIQ